MSTCKYEHPYLLELSNNPKVKLYGVNYKDERLPAQKWLTDYKDPYLFSIFDEEGLLGVKLGVFLAHQKPLLLIIMALSANDLLVLLMFVCGVKSLNRSLNN